jgi:hypothetical protein
MRTWKAEIRLKFPPGGFQEVTVQADDQYRAKAMIEMQYGEGSIRFFFGEVSTEIPSAPSADPQPSSPSSRRDNVALILGAAVFGFLLWMNVPWQWAAGIAVPICFGYVWFGPKF